MKSSCKNSLINNFNKKLIIGIDASNLRQGGGRTHLIELLDAASPSKHGFILIIVWASEETLKLINDKPWLKKINPQLLNQGLISRSFWQKCELEKSARINKCSVLLAPGGTYLGAFSPAVLMSQNLLPFEWKELRRYGLSRTSAKLALLRWIQVISFRRANGTIFLSNYAKRCVENITGKLKGEVAIIPHGLSGRFIAPPREQREIDCFSKIKPFKILYVSSIDQYKHQWVVVEAVYHLRQKTGWPLCLELVGPNYTPALKKLKDCMNRFDPVCEWVKYFGAIEYDQLNLKYLNAEVAVFASTCENMPNILIECMAAGLPIACSNSGPMPEILDRSGIYFNALDPVSISDALMEIIASAGLRTVLAREAFNLGAKYSWDKTALETFKFISNIAGVS